MGWGHSYTVNEGWHGLGRNQQAQHFRAQETPGFIRCQHRMEGVCQGTE